MSRRCELTGTGVLVGNNVSHANNRSKRTYRPNLQQTTLLSDVLGLHVRLRVTTRALRTVDRHGGLDAYLLTAPDKKLSERVRALKRRIEKIRAAQAPAAT